MISQAEVPELLAAAFPAFHLADEGLEFPELAYMVVAVFARQAVAAARSGALDAFPDLFTFIERGLEEGDESAQTLLVVGFLEDLQAEAIRDATPEESFDPDLFTQWMGPKTTEAWRALLTACKGNPTDLKTLVRTLSQARDTRAMTKVELQTMHRAGRAQQRKERRKKK